MAGFKSYNDTCGSIRFAHIDGGMVKVQWWFTATSDFKNLPKGVVKNNGKNIKKV